MESIHSFLTGNYSRADVPQSSEHVLKSVPILGDIFWDSSHLHVKSLAATQEDHSNKHRLLALIEDLQEK